MAARKDIYEFLLQVEMSIFQFCFSSLGTRACSRTRGERKIIVNDSCHSLSDFITFFYTNFYILIFISYTMSSQKREDR